MNKGLRCRGNTACIETRTLDSFMFKTLKKMLTVYTQLLILYKDNFLD